MEDATQFRLELPSDDRLSGARSGFGEARTLVVVTSTLDARWLSACLDSLRAAPSSEFQVAVVLNGSDADAEAILEQHRESVTVLRTHRSLGFAAATNLGLNLALSRGHDYTYLLNPDTRVHPLAIARLIGAMDANPAWGILGSEQCGYGDATWTARNAWWAGMSEDSMRRGLPIEERAGFRVQTCEYVQAAALMVRMAVLRRTGLLDPVYGTFYEETDLCRRVLLVGAGIGVLLGSVVQHAGGGHWNESALRRFHRDFLMARNRGIFLLSDARPLCCCLRDYVRELRTEWHICASRRRPSVGRVALLVGVLALTLKAVTIHRFRMRSRWLASGATVTDRRTAGRV